MSIAFSGSHWRSRAFASSHFGSAGPVDVGVGESHWLGTHWKASQFATKHFRGILAPVESGVGLHWHGFHWKPAQFKTRHFRGILTPVPPATQPPDFGSGTGRIIGYRVIEPKPAKKQRIDPALLAAVLAESDELL